MPSSAPFASAKWISTPTAIVAVAVTLLPRKTRRQAVRAVRISGPAKAGEAAREEEQEGHGSREDVRGESLSRQLVLVEGKRPLGGAAGSGVPPPTPIERTTKAMNAIPLRGRNRLIRRRLLGPRLVRRALLVSRAQHQTVPEGGPAYSFVGLRAAPSRASREKRRGRPTGRSTPPATTTESIEGRYEHGSDGVLRNVLGHEGVDGKSCCNRVAFDEDGQPGLPPGAHGLRPATALVHATVSSVTRQG